ncbi:MAG: tryptophan 2,3-dioxygenase [Calditrichaeota bacterium]|nr:MAG: tryptophan 2,3-dioxygenase [Calditrichota bacterium]
MTRQSPLYYADYLQLDRILNAQALRSAEFGPPAHDETLFIIIHQVYELWFKQILHELNSVLDIFQQDYVNEKQVGIAVSRLERITEIQKILIDQLRVLETMTPLDFLDFRAYLSPASGFQSYQFRLIENKLGILPQKRLRFDQNPYYAQLRPEHQKDILQSEKDPSLFELIEKWLERTPFLEFHGFSFWQSYQQAVNHLMAADQQSILDNAQLSEQEKEQHLQELERNREHFAALFDAEKHRALVASGSRRLSYRATQAALLIHLYRDEPILHLPFRLLTVLVDIDELFTTWRYRHALMVQRMIGTKIGTGGSVGYHYLRSTLEKHKVFTDLFNLSTFLIPRSKLPPLPEEVEKSLGFYYSKNSG